MKQIESFTLRAIQKKDYFKILMWHRSNTTVQGFLNPDFSFYDINSIQNIYDVDRNDNISFIIEAEPKMILGIIIIRAEWENRNGVVDIIMSAGRRMATGTGFKALSEVIKYCKEELNLRRIEIKISEKNKVMQKAMKFFGTDADLICDIYRGIGDWDQKIKAYFSIDQQEYEENWEEYTTQYIKKEIFTSSKPKLILKDDGYMNGQFISYYNDTLLLEGIDSDTLGDVIALSSGDFKKHKKYDEIHRFGSDKKGK